ncbi:MAG: hypothetical protein NC489_23305 [Ruminococcus flavefaciens]|nr:hypothetical protein [Eubacterium sp.]MCM1233062.1 hypothetical protein [Ruminococcus flavefaciens]
MALEGRYLNMMNQWLILKQEGKGIDRYLKKHGYSTVAVYGMAIYGRHVIRELQQSDVKIMYGIDRRVMDAYMNIEVIQPTEGMPPVDLIINTALGDHTNIKTNLAQLINSPVVSLEDIIFESYN